MGHNQITFFPCNPTNIYNLLRKERKEDKKKIEKYIRNGKEKKNYFYHKMKTKSFTYILCFINGDIFVFYLCIWTRV